MVKVTDGDEEIVITYGEAAKLVAEGLIYKCELDPEFDDDGDDFCGDYHPGTPANSGSTEWAKFEKRLMELRVRN